MNLVRPKNQRTEKVVDVDILQDVIRDVYMLERKE